MPCNSDYMEPTQRERLLRQTAQLLELALIKAELSVPTKVVHAARDQYCNIDLVPDLCGLIRSFSSEQLSEIVYNARSRESRDLANWWEEHCAADNNRKESK